MKKTRVLILVISCLFLIGAWGKKKNKDNKLELGRTVIAINDEASMLVTRKGMDPGLANRSIPVVFHHTSNAMVAGPVMITWRDLRADRDLSDDLFAACSDYDLGNIVKQNLSKSFSSAGIEVEDSSKARAVFKRARIMHPVKFADTSARSGAPLGFKSSLIEGANHYEAWQEAVVSSLAKDGLADSLVVINVYLWGLRPGGVKAEELTEEEKEKRYWKTRSMIEMFSSRVAQAILFAEARVIDTKSGKVIFNKDSTYSISDNELTTDQLMKDKSFLFKHYTTCIVEWYAENLKLALKGKPELEDWRCRELTEL
jgi:hypothetical protein